MNESGEKQKEELPDPAKRSSLFRAARAAAAGVFVSRVPGPLGYLFTGVRALNATLAVTFWSLLKTQDYHEFAFALDFLQNKHDARKVAEAGYGEKAIAESARLLEEKFGVTLKLNFGWRDDELKIKTSKLQIPVDRLRTTLVALVNELSIYPPGFVKSDAVLRLNGAPMPVYILDSLEVHSACGGRHVSIAGVATLRKRKEKYETALFALKASDDADYLQRTVHHEYHHVLLMSMQESEFDSFKNRWLQTHRTMPQFDGTEQSIYDDSCESTAYEIDGQSPYISPYARSSFWEDTAVWGEALTNKDTHRKILSILQGPETRFTPILREKYLLTKEIYKTWSKGSIDEKFWVDVLSR